MIKNLMALLAAFALAFVPTLATAQDAHTTGSQANTPTQGQVTQPTPEPSNTMVGNGYNNNSGNQNDSPSGCYAGNLCQGQGTFTFNAFGGVTEAGQAGAVWDGSEHATGEAGASTVGGSLVDIQAAFSTCDDATCAENGVSAVFAGFRQSQSYANVVDTARGVPAMASGLTTSSVIMDGGIGINEQACPGGCPAPGQTGNNTGSGN